MMTGHIHENLTLILLEKRVPKDDHVKPPKSLRFPLKESPNLTYFTGVVFIF